MLVLLSSLVFTKCIKLMYTTTPIFRSQSTRLFLDSRIDHVIVLGHRRTVSIKFCHHCSKNIWELEPQAPTIRLYFRISTCIVLTNHFMPYIGSATGGAGAGRGPTLKNLGNFRKINSDVSTKPKT